MSSLLEINLNGKDRPNVKTVKEAFQMANVTPTQVLQQVKGMTKNALMAAFYGDKQAIEKQWTVLHGFNQTYTPRIAEEKTYQWRFRNEPNNAYHEWERVLREIQYYGGMKFQQELMKIYEQSRQPLHAHDITRQKRLIEGLRPIEKVITKKGKSSNVIEVIGKEGIHFYLHPQFIYDVHNMKYLYKDSQQSLNDLKYFIQAIPNPTVRNILTAFVYANDLRVKTTK